MHLNVCSANKQVLGCAELAGENAQRLSNPQLGQCPPNGTPVFPPPSADDLCYVSIPWETSLLLSCSEAKALGPADVGYLQYPQLLLLSTDSYLECGCWPHNHKEAAMPLSITSIFQAGKG